MNVGKYLIQLANAMTEAELQERVVEAAKQLGWWVFHDYDARMNKAGFPDLLMIHPEHGMLWRELKRQNGKATVDQAFVIDMILRAGGDAAVWRPMDWLDGTVEETLTGNLKEEPSK